MSLKSLVVAAGRVAGIDLVRFRSVRHPLGRRARLMAALGVNLVVDVGANRGQFAAELRRSGYAGRIVSVEALSEPYGFLARTAAADPLLTAIHSAVGARRGRVTMHVAGNAAASSSVLPMLALHARAAPEAEYVGVETVEMRPLDELLQPHLGDPVTLLLKVDVQGYELEVLSGGSTTLSRSSLIQLEMSLVPLYETAPTYREMIDFMAHRGFGLVGLEPGFTSEAGVLLQADGLFASEEAYGLLQSGSP